MGDNGLRLVVDHLGPIEHADIGLRPLTVFVGRNNTGKTYVAQALYAARQAVLGARPVFTDELDADGRGALEELVRRRRSAAAGDEEKLEIPPLLFDVLSKAVSSSLEQAGREVELRLKASFGVDDLGQISSRPKREAVQVEIRSSRLLGTDHGLFGSRGTTAPVGQALRRVTVDWAEIDGYLPFPRLFGDGTAGEEREELHQQIMWLLAGEYWHGYLHDLELTGTPHYLPAGRSGLLNAWTDVVKLRIQLERERFGLPSFPEPSLDGVALDFISSLADVLGSHTRGGRAYRRFGRMVPQSGRPELEGVQQLLRQVMEGRITSDSRQALVPTLAYEQAGQSIAIRHASSMVADLAPLAIWVDRLLAPKDLLIVDEPESHLHPEAIRIVARALVRLVNSGVRVVCATHSSVLLHELSNSVLRHAVDGLPQQDIDAGYAAEDCLSIDDLAVHRFVRPTSAGPVQVEQLKIDPEWGIPEDEYVKVAADLSDDSARLVNSLK